MSNVTSPKARSNERPDQGLEQVMTVDVAPSADPDISGDASEEGEINEKAALSIPADYSVDQNLNISIATSPKTGSNERPDQGLEQVTTVKVAPSANAEKSSDGDEEGEIKEDLPLGTKRKHSPSREEQPPSKRTKPDPELTGCSFRKMRQPRNIVPCVVSVNQGTPIGTLYQAKEGFAITMYTDPGRFRPPTIKVGLRTHGTEQQKDHASFDWNTLSMDRGQWAMSRIEHGYSPLNGSDPRRSNAAVHALCKVSDIGNLLYMTFTSWTQTRGFQQQQRVQDSGQRDTRFAQHHVKSSAAISIGIVVYCTV